MTTIRKNAAGLVFGRYLYRAQPEQTLVSLELWKSDVLIYRKAALWQKIPSAMLALGIVEQGFEAVTTIEVETDDRLYAYSEGITETVNSDGEEFGQQRVEQIIHQLLITHAKIDFLGETVQSFQCDIKSI